MFGNNGARIASWIIGFLPVSRCRKLKIWLLRRVGGIEIGEGCGIWSGARFVGRYIKIGRNCHVGEGCYLAGLSKEGSITIGDEVSLGPGVFMTTGTHDIGSKSRRSGRGRLYPIKIGNGVALSVRSIIMPNVTIGAGCFIGPGVVVSRDVKPNTMLGNATPRGIPLPEDEISWE